MARSASLIDSGPIAYRAIELFGDPDLEHGLRHLGVEPSEATFRLLEIPVEALSETRVMASWTWTSQPVIEAMRMGHRFPPIVVSRTAQGWSLIDGVNRSYAAWHLAIPTLTAYELIQGPANEH